MATSDKCPRCDCEGDNVACGICFYYNFRCAGNCKCCTGQRETSTQRQARLTQSIGIDRTESTQTQSEINSDNSEVESTQRKVAATHCMDQKKAYAKRQKRAPVRPLILRNVKKSLADSQKKESNSVFQSKADDSIVNASSTEKVNAETQTISPSIHKVTDKVNSPVNEPKENKADFVVNEEKPNKVKSAVFEQPKEAIWKSESQITLPQYVVPQYETPQHEAPLHKVTLLVEHEIRQLPFLKKFLIKEEHQLQRQWNRIFWPQWEKVPCKSANQPQIETKRDNLNIIKEKLKEKNRQLIGDHCLNCHCRHTREPCDICRLSDYQCLGKCLCCKNFRFGQRFMVFVTGSPKELLDGSFYGGGNISM